MDFFFVGIMDNNLHCNSMILKHSSPSTHFIESWGLHDTNNFSRGNIYYQAKCFLQEEDDCVYQTQEWGWVISFSINSIMNSGFKLEHGQGTVFLTENEYEENCLFSSSSVFIVNIRNEFKWYS